MWKQIFKNKKKVFSKLRVFAVWTKNVGDKKAFQNSKFVKNCQNCDNFFISIQPLSISLARKRKHIFKDTLSFRFLSKLNGYVLFACLWYTNSTRSTKMPIKRKTTKSNFNRQPREFHIFVPQVPIAPNSSKSSKIKVTRQPALAKFICGMWIMMLVGNFRFN